MRTSPPVVDVIIRQREVRQVSETYIETDAEHNDDHAWYDQRRITRGSELYGKSARKTGVTKENKTSVVNESEKDRISRSCQRTKRGGRSEQRSVRSERKRYEVPGKLRKGNWRMQVWQKGRTTSCGRKLMQKHAG